MEALGQRHLLKITAKVDRRFADAEAHAARALTARLDDARDGRPTAAVLGQSLSFRAALARIDDAAGAVIEGIQAARRDLYRLAYRSHAEYLAAWDETSGEDPVRPPGATLVANKADVRAVGSAVLFGRTPLQQMSGRAEAARATLKAAMVRAGVKAVTQREAEDLIVSAIRPARDGFRLEARLSITTAIAYADKMGARHNFRADLLEPIPGEE